MAELCHDIDMNQITNAIPAAKDIKEGSVGWMLKVICTALDAEMTSRLKELDLNISQFAVLMTLSEMEGLTQTEIGQKVTMPGYATTRTIDALEKKKFVERRRDERSRRCYRIYLTDQGRTITPELFKIVRNVNERLLLVLSSKEKNQLIAILKKLVMKKGYLEKRVDG